jgi:excisionase family DNA binding protein
MGLGPSAMLPPLERYLTLGEVSEITRFSKSTVRRRIKDGTGPRVCRMSGKLLRIPESALHAWMNSQA